MKPKEKAKELVDRFTPMATDITPIQTIEKDYRWAKKCALICVDEIINNFGMTKQFYTSYSAVQYWQEVKQEIQN